MESATVPLAGSAAVPPFATAENGHLRELVQLPITSLVPDPITNRTVDPRWVAHIAEGFNPHVLGLLTGWISESEPDIIKLLDGQHRLLAAEVVGWTGDVACNVYRGLKQSEAADLFLEINETRHVSVIDKFRKAVLAEHAIEVAIAGILTEHGVEVGTSMGQVKAPGALKNIYKSKGGGGLLHQIVACLIRAFPEMGAGQALQADMLEALLNVERKYSKNKETVDYGRMCEQLKPVPINELFADRDFKHRENPRYSKRWHLARVIVEKYNDGFRGKEKLSPWSDRAA
jgi:hypothetical protein